MYYEIKGAWLILYDDYDRRPEVFLDKDQAEKRFEQISDSWNAHLFERIGTNCQTMES